MLNITVHGYGNHIAKFTLDGKVSTPRISSRLGGFHNVDIILDDNNETKDTLITKVNNHFSPNYPTLYLSSNRSLAWTKIPNIDHYKILCNGIVMDSLTNRNINDLHWDIPIPEKYTEYQVIAIDSNGYEGFASEPLAVYAPQYKQVISLHQDHASLPIDTIKNVFGTYPIEISETKNTSLNFNATVQEKGNYVIQFYYANGSGSLISENMCANRTLMVDNKVVSVVSFPQRGKDLWNVWGYSGCLLVQLGKGLHLMSLSFGAENENMNQQGINRALLDHVNIIQVQ